MDEAAGDVLRRGVAAAGGERARRGVLHADVKPDNLLVRNGGDDWCDWAAHRPGSWKQKGLALIDLGRAVDLAEDFPDAVFVGDVNTEGFDARR